MNSINANDCSPFPQDLNNNEKEAIRMLCEYFARSGSGGEEDDEIASLRTSKFDDDIQTRWWAGRYIGLAYIALPSGTKEIAIRPRFGLPFLFAMIEDLYGLNNIRESIHDGVENKGNEWFSALLNLLRKRIWVDKCAKANRYGLPRINEKRVYQGVSLRGALDVTHTLIPWLKKKELCSRIYEKTYDDSICRIVYEAHRILSRNVIENRVGIRRRKKRTITNKVGLSFSIPPAVQETIDTLNCHYKGKSFDLTESDYQRICYKSIFLSWKPLVDYSWGVIRNQRLGYKAAFNQTQCVFVDMAEIWEEFLRKKLGEGFANDGWRVWSIEECCFHIYKDTFYGRQIIPDIILQKEHQFMVFDAKYNRMNGFKTNAKDSDVDRSDLFQIHTYIQFVQQNLGEVVIGGLLYPITQDLITQKDQVDTSIYHSNSLFGSGKSNTHFIVDGICCSEEDDHLSFETKVQEMINRIKKYTN